MVAQGGAADHAWGNEGEVGVTGDLAQAQAQGVLGVVGEHAEVFGAAVGVWVEGVVAGALVEAGQGGFGLGGERGDEVAAQEGAVFGGEGAPFEAEEDARR
ncbi:hypothetical protein DEGR_38650 (plasmid) [Deinococcus grandis]|nr:hypothetical protein DEGR_38650 [Deinococcus grandis]